MNRQIQLATMMVFAIVHAACGNSEPVNIGDIAKLGASLSDYQGTWDGYVEASEFADGSDRIRISLDANGNGVIEVGDSAALPPPVAGKGYPLQDPNDPECQSPLSASKIGSLIPGFSYPVTAAKVEERRVRFSTASSDLYREWCALMTPVLDEVNSTATDPVYSCLPNTTGFFVDEQCYLDTEPVDCCLLTCLNVCECDSDGCTAPDDQDVSFDGALQADGNELEGTLAIGDRMTVRLMRQ